MHVEAAGICCLGVFIGFLVWYFVVRIGAGKVTAATLASVTGVLVGGVVLTFLDDHIANKGNVWWYPIGLVIGFVLYQASFFVNARRAGKSPVTATLGPQEPAKP